MIADAGVQDENPTDISMASTSGDSKTEEDHPKEEENAIQPPEPEPVAENGEVSLENSSPTIKEDQEDARASSEDEDKLVINEICDKKETQVEVKHLEEFSSEPSSVPTPPPPPPPPPPATLPLHNAEEERKSSVLQNDVTENHSVKSPLKRTANEVEASDAPSYSAKKPRTLEYEEESQRASSPTHLEKSLSQLKKDLQGIELLLLQKEEEWNCLLRLQKKKEELYIRLLRKNQIRKARDKDYVEGEMSEGEDNVVFLPQGTYTSLGSSQFPLMMLKHMLGENNMPQVQNSKESFSKGSSTATTSNGPVMVTSQNSGSVNVIDIHTNNSKSSIGSLESPQISISSEVHSKLGRHLNSMMSVKPILPKPSNSVGGISNTEDTPPPLSYPSTGYGPQGPTVSVHHLIAAHRKDNPSVTPISLGGISNTEDTPPPLSYPPTGYGPKGPTVSVHHLIAAHRGAKRGAWRQKYENEKRNSPREIDRPSSVSSSNSETEVRVNPNPPLNSKGNVSNNNNLLTMNDPSVSYKDVLLQFAQLTQTEKQPGSPQISIIPVSSGEMTPRKLEHTPDSTSASRELSSTPQSSNYSHNLEGSSALAKLLLESGAGNHVNVSKSSAVDLSSYNSSPHCLTLSALLSGGTTTTVKDKINTPSIAESRSKKNGSTEDGNTNPKCQGCHKHRAQFVCAGCSNQWYCSRNCQVTAWEKHSEHCSS